MAVYGPAQFHAGLVCLTESNYSLKSLEMQLQVQWFLSSSVKMIYQDERPRIGPSPQGAGPKKGEHTGNLPRHEGFGRPQRIVAPACGHEDEVQKSEPM